MRTPLPQLSSQSIQFTPARQSHAAFIFGLRIDSSLNRYLSAAPDSVDAQREYLRTYEKRELAGSEFYFVIEDRLGTPCGTVRVYDIRPQDRPHSFSWGSWILNDSKPRYASIESALLVYRVGFEHLGCSASHFEVMKGNDRVVEFHRRFGATVESETDESFTMVIGRAEFEAVQSDLQKLVLGEKLQ
jgi:RimJ/RimL family protein N-acetyltransferase